MKKILLILFVLLLAIGSYTMYFIVNNRFPLRYVDIINHYANIHGVDPILIASIINVESRFNPRAVSPVGASGLMQIMEGTAYWIAEQMEIEDFVYSTMIFDPYININMGTWYISRLKNIYDTKDVALAAYNAGSGRVNSWLSDPDFSDDGITLTNIPFRETRNYVERVNLNMRIYSVLGRRALN